MIKYVLVLLFGAALGVIAVDLVETHGYFDCVFTKFDAEKYFDGYWKVMRLTTCR